MYKRQRLETVLWPSGSTTVYYFLAINAQELNYDVRTGDKTPGFHARVAKGEKPLPVNYYNRVVKEGIAYATGIRKSSFDRYQSGKSYPYDGNRYTMDSIITATPHSYSVFDLAYASERSANVADSIAKLQSNIENVIVDAPVELAEGRETAEMVLNRVKGLVNYATHFKKKNERAYKSLAKAFRSAPSSGARGKYLKGIAEDANGLFLEYNFGWIPLYHLFGDAAELLAKQLDQSAPREKMSGKNKLVRQNIIETPNSYFYSPLSASLGSFTKVVEHRYTHTVWHGGLLASTTRRESIQQQLGLNANNIIPALWELVTASFVVDYFVNVGDVLGNLKNSQSHLNPSSLYRTVKWEYECDVSYKKIVDPVNAANGSIRYHDVSFHEGEDKSSCKYMQFTRTPINTSNLVVPLHMQSQSWDHIVKTLSVAAALTGAFRK